MDFGDEPLSRYPALRTRDVDELRQRLWGLYSVRSIDLGRGARLTFEGHLNHREMRDVGLSYVRYGAPIVASATQRDHFIQGAPFRGGGPAVIDGLDGLVSHNRGVVDGPGTEMLPKYSPDFEHLVLRINPQGLTRKLSALIGRPVDPPLTIEGDFEPREGAAQQLRLLQFVVGELDRNDASLPALVLAELKQALIVTFLVSNRHNYSHLLNGHTPAVAPWQVRRVEEYIEQNWDQPLTVEALALIADVSLRSLFYAFKKSRGVSPMAFVKQVRMRRARAMLIDAGSAASVASAAFACGFSNLGHFARTIATPSANARPTH